MNMSADEKNVWKLNLSIIIPVYNEEENIMGLAQEVEKVMYDTSWSWECLWIDDGSTDRTLYKLQQIHERDNHHQFIALSQNYGQSAALSVGFRFSRGAIIATLDGDGQNDPADIPSMIKKLLELDADMINGWREKRRDSIIKKLSSQIANGFRNWMTHEQVRDVGCSLRVFRHKCVENLPTFRGMHRFLPTLARMSGCKRIIEMPVHHRPRKYGLTKYGIHNRLWVGIVDTLAVRWMQVRLVYPELKSSSRDKGGGKPE